MSRRLVTNLQGNGASTLKIKNLALCLPLLLLVGCTNANPAPIAQQPRIPARSQGVDLSTDAGRVAQYIKINGLDFVARYYHKACRPLQAVSANEATWLA